MGDAVLIELLGRFAVHIDGREVDGSAFERRSGMELVQLLALSDRRTLHREQVMEALWPDASLKTATNGLHKAATFARSALGRSDAVVIRDELVLLLPGDGGSVEIDVDVVTTARAADTHSVDRAVAAYRGELLPDTRYAEWVVETREHVRRSYLALLEGAKRWDEILAVDPWHEGANIALMQRALAAGDRQGVLRRFAELEEYLRVELGLVPSAAAVALRDEALADRGVGVSAGWGMRTFLLTDIEGSTEAWSASPTTLGAVLARHDELVTATIERSGGAVFKHMGDGLFAVFDGVSEAVDAAVGIQRAIQSADWGQDGRPRLRIGVEVGEAEPRNGDWFGPVLNRTARITAAGNGDQILCSGLVADLAGARSADVSLENLGRFGLPGLAPVILHRVMAPGLIDRAVVPRASRVSGRVIGALRERIIGRSHELAELARLVSTNPLVTVTGAGGAGKTHLARHVASAIRHDYPGGVYLAELGTVDDESGAHNELLSAIGAQHQTDTTVRESIMRSLGNRRVILVVDNCEHLVEPVADLCREIAERCPGTQLLATSREPLRTATEVLFPLGELTRDAARELFCAEAAARGVTIDERDPGLDRICERLDDLPMAVRLAAARTGFIGIDMIESLLADRFEFLTDDRRTGLEHHETLGTAIAWSFDALAPELQATLADLSVLSGRFTLDTALAITDRGDTSPATLINRIDELRQRSLVAATRTDGQPIYRLLESVRLFARERATDDGAMGRHLDHFRHQAEAWNVRLCDGQDDAYAWFRDTWSDLRQAFATASRLDRFEDVTAILAACSVYCNSTLTFEMLEWCEAALDPHATPGETLTNDHALALTGWSALATHRGEMALADSLVDRALTAVPDSAWAFYAKAWIPFSVTDMEQAEVWLARIPDAPDCSPALEGGALGLQSIITFAKGEDATPIARRLETLALGRGEVFACQEVLARGLAALRDDWPTALACLDEARALGDANGLVPFSATCVTARALGASLHQPLDVALEAFIEAVGWHRQNGLWAYALAGLGTAALLLEGLERYDEAVTILSARIQHGFISGFTSLLAAEVLARAEDLHSDEYSTWYEHGQRLDLEQTTLFGLRAMENALADARSSSPS